MTRRKSMPSPVCIFALSFLACVLCASALEGIDRDANGDSTSIKRSPKDNQAGARPKGQQHLANSGNQMATMGGEVAKHLASLLGSKRTKENGKGRNADHFKGLQEFFNKEKAEYDKNVAKKDATMPNSLREDEFTKALDKENGKFGKEEASEEKKLEGAFEDKAKAFDSTMTDMAKGIPHKGFEGFSSGLVDKDPPEKAAEHKAAAMTPEKKAEEKEAAKAEAKRQNIRKKATKAEEKAMEKSMINAAEKAEEKAMEKSMINAAEKAEEKAIKAKAKAQSSAGAARAAASRAGAKSGSSKSGAAGLGSVKPKKCNTSEACEDECQIGAWRAVEGLVRAGAITAKCDHFDPLGNKGRHPTSPSLSSSSPKDKARKGGDGKSKTSKGKGMGRASKHVRSKNLLTTVSGYGDGATAADNLRDAFRGVPVKLSGYRNAPGGQTCLSVKLATLLVGVAQVGVIDINSLAGSSHEWHPAHYNGKAVDIGSVNGVPLDRKHRDQAIAIVDACRKNGATQIYNVNMDCGEKCDAHDTWVHCRVE